MTSADDLMPGLIDGHAHLFGAHDGRVDTTERMSEQERAAVAERAAREVLRAGITTAATSAGRAVRGDALLRDRINDGSRRGAARPRATRKLTPPGGQGRNLSEEVVRREIPPVVGAAGRAARRARGNRQRRGCYQGRR